MRMYMILLRKWKL